MEGLKTRMVAGVRLLDAGDRMVPPVLAGADQVLTVEEHESRLTDIRSRMEEINTEAAGQRFTEAQRAEWNQLGQERDDTAQTIEELRTRQQVLREQAEDPENREAGAHFNTPRAGVARGGDIWDLTTVRMTAADPNRASGELRDRAKRALETAHFPHVDAGNARGHIEGLLNADPDIQDFDSGALARRLLVTGSPQYRRGFMKTIMGRPLSSDEQRALSIGSTGNYPVPFTVDPTIVPTSNGSVNPLRSISRVIQITGNTWKGVSSGAITASYGAEATEATDNTPTLAQPSANVERAQAFVPFSIEADQDWSSLQSEMALLFQDAKDDLEATKFLSGAGHASQEPQGLLTGATTTTAAGGTASFAVADVYKVEEALPPRFRPRAQWVANRFTYNKVRQFDTSGGAALWMTLERGLANTQGGNTNAQLIGYPANELSTMAAALTTASKIAVLGDFRYFVIVDRIGMDVELIPHLFGGTANYPTGQRGLFAIWRNTSVVISANAFRVLVTG